MDQKTQQFRWLSKALLVATLSSLGLNAWSQSDVSAEYRSCMDRVDEVPLQFKNRAACMTQEIKRQDVVLNAEYQQLKRKLKPDQRELLVKAQRTWVKFRSDWCALEKVSDSAPGGELNRLLCIMELTDQQIKAIKAIS